MTNVEITQITGCTPPYEIYVCDVYGNQCVWMADILSPIPPPIIFTLPPPFDNAPAVGILIVSLLTGCEDFEVYTCIPEPSQTPTTTPTI